MNQSYEYDFSVMIGRFLPWHKGHNRNLLKALEISQHVIIILGSHRSTKTFAHPFSSEERIEYISQCIPEEERYRVHFNTVEDTTDLLWFKNVQSAVSAVIKDYYVNDHLYPAIALIGHNKDETSFYLNNFKNYKLIDIGPFVKEKNGIPLSSTKIRELLFTNYLDYTESVVPPQMYQWLQQWITTDNYKLLQEEYDYDRAYLPDAHRKILSGEYSTIFYCTDAVIFQSAHVLLIRRKFASGKSLIAVPGGHVNSDETAFEAIIREISEETNLRVPEKVLRGSLKEEKLFDSPTRSLRGTTVSKNVRTITISHCFKLADGAELPRCAGGDDASEAWWYPLDQIEEIKDQFMDDHYEQIMYFMNRY